tara:strand:+ start:310 stop:570 length:261 start_codon:yes stop_codon:yes gene_type:complete
MKTTVKNLDKGTYGMTANMKKLLVHIIELNNPKCFNAKIKANRTKLMIEPQGNDIYKVTEYMNRPSMLTGGSYEKENTYNVQVITK